MYIQYIYISQLLYALYLPSHHYSTSVLFFFFFSNFVSISEFKIRYFVQFFLYIYSIKTSNFSGWGTTVLRLKNTEF